MKGIKMLLFALLICTSWNCFAQKLERPFIWVKQAERHAIMNKIETQPWAKTLYENFQNRLNEDFNNYLNNPREFLLGIPLESDKRVKGQTTPPLNADSSGRRNRKYAKTFMTYLQVGIDCGVMYYLTQERKYAQCATDILNVFVQGLNQIIPFEDPGNGGWLYDDHLYEARVIGAQIPIIYDFIYPYIESGGRAYDISQNRDVAFSIEDAQKVFRTYVQLALDRGMTGTNWGVLEAASMVHNTLALENEIERKKFLEYYLSIGSERQDPLSVVALEFQKEGDVYPETSQYSNGVASKTTHLMVVLAKYDKTLRLAQKYPFIPLALSRWDAMKYPNGEIIRFGDGKRNGGTDFISCETAYYLGEIEQIENLTKTFGSIITTAIAEGKYKRESLEPRSYGARYYSDPIRLLWFSDGIRGEIVEQIPPRTDDMPHASVYLQRNLSPTSNPEDGLMCFVGGAHMVHGHASGMDMELYGKGQVLGVDHGNGKYRTEIHENYSRIFAAHNSVIVNGSSQSEGGWVNLGINPVQLVAMEPMPREDAVSPYHSFTQTIFLDDKGDKAEAEQQRTLALIRTSSTTGYYVDVFRSKSKLPNEYHDYLYHNIGDELTFHNMDLPLKSDPDRYMANANDEWKQNRKYRHPGWHYFKDVQTSDVYYRDVKARFSVEKLENSPIYMGLHIPGFENREYTKVQAPHTFQAPEPYLDKPTPTLVIRKKGEAWMKPFVVVYEPFGNDGESVVSVEKLEQDGNYKGLKVVSEVSGERLVQYVITLPKNEVYQDKRLGLYFKGIFAVVSLDDKGNLQNTYIGDGEKLVFGGREFIPEGNNRSLYKEDIKK